MNTDSKSIKNINNILNFIFNTSDIEHYELIADSGLNYSLIEEIEYIDNYKKVVEGSSPFSTFVSNLALKNNEIIKEVDKPEVIKSHFVGKFISSVKSIFSTKEFDSTPEEKMFSESINKCISDELLKSKRVLDNKELNFPALLLLTKAIKNIENPSYEGIPNKVVQEVGVLQLGLALESMKYDKPELYKYNKAEARQLNKLVSDNINTNFLKKAVKVAGEQNIHIEKLTEDFKNNLLTDSFIDQISNNILSPNKKTTFRVA